MSIGKGRECSTSKAKPKGTGQFRDMSRGKGRECRTSKAQPKGTGECRDNRTQKAQAEHRARVTCLRQLLEVQELQHATVSEALLAHRAQAEMCLPLSCRCIQS